MKNENKKLDNRFTIITGACGGLGSAFCECVAQSGENLIITGTNSERLEAKKQELLGKFHDIKVFTFKMDLSVPEERVAFFEFLKENNLKPHRLINNAGFIAEGGLLDFSDDKVLKIIRVNCEGNVDLTQKFIKMMGDNIEILTVSSLGAFYPMPYMSVYSATKRMIECQMVALHEEVKPKNIKVSALCPGGIPTTKEMIDAIKAQGLGGKLSSQSPEYIAKYALKKLEKNKAVIIPGAFNRFLHFMGHFASETTIAKMVGKRWAKANKKRTEK
ncbi:MAG: SDR family NAD(P)-dependent oxidoreductase [Clostridia bacterium]|nr:SDR family NAD(P)-dependent oxidoreductase [Clostridia bacterium]